MTDPAEAQHQLAALDLDADTLLGAVDDGVRAASLCTAFDPPLTGPVLAWSRITRGLRERLVPRGWRADDSGNYSVVVDAHDEVAIVVASGSADTGKESGRPTTKSPKGPATRRAVDRNSLQTRFAEFEASFRAVEGIKPRQTWVLLFRIDRETEAWVPQMFGLQGGTIRLD
ncbi:MAG: hypothetical protein ACYCTZ_15425 [Candidatus Dormibacteria bacterium]